jgi:glycosyltransferase involved in cell wall biosynthesis
MRNRILVLGYFGYVTNQLDGQTIKTRSIYNLLKNKDKYIGSIKIFDSQSFQQNKLYILKMFWLILLCDKLVYIPAQNNLTYLFPFIYIICNIKHIDILYIVVGGWLPDYLRTKKLHVYLLKKIRGIFCESNLLRDTLIQRYQFDNVSSLHNFRIHSFVPSVKPMKDDFKIVFMARINRMKGIDAVFRLAERMEAQHDKKFPISIDFYGPIEPKDKIFFRDQIEKYPIVSYKGILAPEQIYDTLTTYDLSILPTKYPGEGFPGTILDSYISGLPVIVSNWKNIPEFVDEGKTGYVYNLNNEEEFYYYVDKLYKNRKLLFEMKQNAYEKSKMYSSERALIILQNYLFDKKE